MTRYTIYWLTRDVGIIDRIRRRFGIIKSMTVNGENAVEVDSEKDLADLEDCEKNGLIQLRKKQ